MFSFLTDSDRKMYPGVQFLLEDKYEHRNVGQGTRSQKPWGGEKSKQPQKSAKQDVNPV